MVPHDVEYLQDQVVVDDESTANQLAHEQLVGPLPIQADPATTGHGVVGRASDDTIVSAPHSSLESLLGDVANRLNEEVGTGAVHVSSIGNSGSDPQLTTTAQGLLSTQKKYQHGPTPTASQC